jgi:hypothetical protein
MTAAVKDPDAWKSGLIAIAGAIVMVTGTVRSGDNRRTVAKARRILGGFGLVVAPIAGVLSLLQLGTDPSAAGGFVVLTVVALVSWVQAIALQAGLSVRVAASWLGLAIGFAAVAFPIAGGIGAAAGAVLRGIGLSSGVASATGAAVAVAIVTAVLGVWATNRPDRQAVPGAVRRAGFGHGLPGDIDILAAGPGRILGRLSTSTADAQEQQARIAALDRRIGPEVASETATTVEGDDTRAGDD